MNRILIGIVGLRAFILEKVLGNRVYFIIVIGNMFSAVFSFGLQTGYARVLDPADFGLLSTLVASCYFFTVLTDLGCYKTIVHFYNRNPEDGDQVIASGFIIRIIAYIGVLLLLLFNRKYISEFIGLSDLGDDKFIIILFLVLSSSLYLFSLTVSNAGKLFSLYNFQKIIIPAVRLLILVLFIWVIGRYTVENAILHVTILYLMVFIISAYLVGIKKYINYDRKWIYKLLSFGKWIYLSQLLFVFQTRMDLFIVKKFMGFSEVGKYSIALMILTIFDLILEPVGIVLLPNVAKYREEKEYKNLIRNSTYLLFLTLIPVLILMPFVDIITHSLFGKKYAESSFLIQIILMKFPINAFIIPFSTMIYPLGKPKIMLYGSLLYIIVNGVVGSIMTNYYGTKGMAMSSVIASLILSTFMLISVRCVIRKNFSDTKMEIA